MNFSPGSAVRRVPTSFSSRDVGTVERGCDARFSFETLQPVPVRSELLAEHFDGDFAAELEILRAVHFSLPPLPMEPTTSYGPRRVPAARGIVGAIFHMRAET